MTKYIWFLAIYIFILECTSVASNEINDATLENDIFEGVTASEPKVKPGSIQAKPRPVGAYELLASKNKNACDGALAKLNASGPTSFKHDLDWWISWNERSEWQLIGGKDGYTEFKAFPWEFMKLSSVWPGGYRYAYRWFGCVNTSVCGAALYLSQENIHEFNSSVSDEAKKSEMQKNVHKKMGGAMIQIEVPHNLVYSVKSIFGDRYDIHYYDIFKIGGEQYLAAVYYAQWPQERFVITLHGDTPALNKPICIMASRFAINRE